MEIRIEKMDSLGSGIGYLNNKVVFVPKSFVGDILDIEIIQDKKNYSVGNIKKIIKPSLNRIKPVCPYFDLCGGCNLLHISYEDSKKYKLDKVNELFKRNNIQYNIDNIVSIDKLNYRNKVSLKVENGLVGYYKSNSHNLVSVDYCYLVSISINEIIKDLDMFNIINGEITIRCNYKCEILIVINSKDNIVIKDILNKHSNIVGIIYNDKIIYGNNYFIDKINDYLFKVSYNSFFQVNAYISGEIFDKLDSLIEDNTKVLDLYCGVGTLSVVASNHSTYTLGVEINDNAIENAKYNALLNGKDNIEFICSDTVNILDKISSDYDVVVLDPPRSGVHLKVIKQIIEEKINKIIYISCNPATLVRDLNVLNKYYDIKEVTLYDMFMGTHHVESMVVLEIKE